MTRPRVIAHRGASGERPENTHAAFARAVELGADMIETDLHLTRDAAIVIHHDAPLERLGAERGPVGHLDGDRKLRAILGRDELDGTTRSIVRAARDPDHVGERRAGSGDGVETRTLNRAHHDLEVTADHVLVLKNAGPVGGPGMPEWGMLPIPQKLLKQGVRDMIRISDARMSGTAFGTVILHVSPEAQAGGPLALVKTGDRIRVSASKGELELLVDEQELAARRADWQPDDPHYTRGYAKLYIDHVLQADQGADLDFLVGKDTRLVTRESH